MAVIVVGVLLALAVNGWNQDRLDVRLGNEYVDRLISDLEADATRMDGLVAALRSKDSSLVDLESGATSPDSESIADLVEAVANSLTLAFNAPSVRTTTIDEMKSTGRLPLIRSSEIRDTLLLYYSLALNAEERLEGRMTRYPDRVFERVPQSLLAWRRIAARDRNESGELPANLRLEDGRILRAWLSEPETASLINAERNYSSQAIQILESNRDFALELIRTLRELRDG